jgi:hypothetical protein
MIYEDSDLDDAEYKSIAGGCLTAIAVALLLIASGLFLILC